MTITKRCHQRWWVWLNSQQTRRIWGIGWQEGGKKTTTKNACKALKNGMSTVFCIHSAFYRATTTKNNMTLPWNCCHLLHLRKIYILQITNERIECGKLEHTDTIRARIGWHFKWLSIKLRLNRYERFRASYLLCWLLLLLFLMSFLPFASNKENRRYKGKGLIRLFREIRLDFFFLFSIDCIFRYSFRMQNQRIIFVIASFSRWKKEWIHTSRWNRSMIRYHIWPEQCIIYLLMCFQNPKCCQ